MDRQLHLFKGKRQRGVALPRAKEFELHCMVADVLRRWCDPMWRYTHMPMGEKREPVTAMRLKRMGVTRGWADFLLVGPLGKVVWLELKRPGMGRRKDFPGVLDIGTPSDEQEELAKHLTGVCGHTYICTNDFQHALDLLRDHGIVRARVSA